MVAGDCGHCRRLNAVAAEFGSRYVGVSVLRSRAGVQLLRQRWKGHFLLEDGNRQRSGLTWDLNWMLWNLFRRCRSMHGDSLASGEAKPSQAQVAVKGNDCVGFLSTHGLRTK